MRNASSALSISFSSQNIRAFERQQFDACLPMKAVSSQKRRKIAMPEFSKFEITQNQGDTHRLHQ